MRVTQNLVTDQIRRRRTRALDEEIDTDLLAAEQPAAADQHHQHSLKALVEECIAGLADPYRTIVIMREIQGLGYQEIAAILDISLDHVKTDLFRAKRKLRELVSRHPHYDQHLLED
jgi:RNA polymerase sigma-70 factor (ECF subfamily)